MKVATVATFATLTLIVGAVASSRSAEPNTTEVFMRAKLEHSQRILEGLTTEDFKIIAQSAERLETLSQDASWNILQTPEYMRQSVEFRRNAEELAKAAENKNLDGASLAYMDVMLNCINCHKYVRSIRLSQAETLSEFYADRRWDDSSQ